MNSYKTVFPRHHPAMCPEALADSTDGAVFKDLGHCPKPVHVKSPRILTCHMFGQPNLVGYFPSQRHNLDLIRFKRTKNKSPAPELSDDPTMSGL